MAQQVTFLRTELQHEQRMLKHKAELEALGGGHICPNKA